MAETATEAAKWRAMDEAIRSTVEKYEQARRAWILAPTSSEYLQAETEMDRAARDVANYLALALPVAP